MGFAKKPCRLPPYFILAFFFFFDSLCFVFKMSVSASHAGETIKVGGYNLKPLFFIDGDSVARGLFIDILDHIAGLLVSIAAIEERERQYVRRAHCPTACCGVSERM